MREYTAEDIVVLTELEALRRRPGMYVGSVGPEGQRRAVGLALRWAVAQHLAGQARRLDVKQESGGRFVVSWDGEGPLPADDDGGWEANVQSTHGYFRGVDDLTNMLLGLRVGVLNGLSEDFHFHVERDEVSFHQGFSRGVPLGPPAEARPSGAHRITLSFRLDPTVFEGAFPVEDFEGDISLVAALHPGLRVWLDEREVSQPRGLVDFAERQLPWTGLRFRHVRTTLDGVRVQLATADLERAEGALRIWVNGEPIVEGTPFEALVDWLGGRREEGAVVLLSLHFGEPCYLGRPQRGIGNRELVPLLGRLFRALDDIPSSLDGLVDATPFATAVLLDWAREHGRAAVLDAFATRV
ncbi:MAG: hypothetical protein AAF602_11055 [Myxococcota bacterium]